MQFVDYLNYFKPKMFIMENVRGVLSMKTSEGELCSKIILEHLTKDYNCIPFSLYARDFEVPQIRNRVLFIGIRKDIGKEPTCPEKINPNNHIPVSSVLLTEKEVDLTEGQESLTALKMPDLRLDSSKILSVAKPLSRFSASKDAKSIRD